MGFDTLNALSQKELLLLLFGFFLGVSTRIGGFIFTLAISPIKRYFKHRKKKRKKLRRPSKKEHFLQWKAHNSLENLTLKELNQLIYELENKPSS